jgi:mannose-6-phosphate isomerase
MNNKQSYFSILPYQKKVEKPWGFEILFTPEKAQAVGKLLHIKAGCRLSFQYHDEKEETGVLISGQAHLLIEDQNGQMQEVDMEPKKGYFITPFQKHRYIAVTDCDIFESSTKESGNTFRLEDDYKRDTETEEVRKDPNRGWQPAG